MVPATWPRRLVALAGTVLAATAFTVWNQSVVNEKVYTLSLLSIALVLWLTVRWGDAPVGSRRDHRLLLIVYLLALTATNHLMGLLVIPAVLVYVLYTDPKVLLSPRFLAWSAVAVALGVSLWLFLLVRAPHFPPINEGEPTNWAALREVLNRTQYEKPPLGDRQADFGSQLAMWWQYFTWQWGRDWAAGVRRALAVLFGGLGLLGAWRPLEGRAGGRAGHDRADGLRSSRSWSSTSTSSTGSARIPPSGRSMRCASGTTSSSARSRCGESGSRSAWRR